MENEPIEVKSAVNTVHGRLKKIVTRVLAYSGEERTPVLTELLDTCSRLEQDLKAALSTSDSLSPTLPKDEGGSGGYTDVSRLLAESQTAIFNFIKANPNSDALKLKGGIWEAFSDLSNRLFREFIAIKKAPKQCGNLDDLTSENDELKKLNEELLKELSDAQHESKKLMEFVSKLHEDKTNLNKKQAEMHAQVEFFKNKLKSTSESKKETVQRNDELRKLNEAAMKQMRELSDNCEILKEDIMRLESGGKGTSSDAIRLRSENEGLKLKIDTMQSVAKSKESEHQETKKLLDKALSETQHHLAIVEKLQSELKAKESAPKRSEFDTEISQLKETIESLSVRKSNLEVDIRALQSDNQSLRSQLKDISRLSHKPNPTHEFELEQSVVTLQREIALLQQQNSELNTSLQNAFDATSQLKAEKSELIASDPQSSGSSPESGFRRRSGKRSTVAGLSDEIHSLEEQLANVIDERDALQKMQNWDLNDEFEKCKAQIVTVTEENAELAKEVKELQTYKLEMEKMRNTVDELRTESVTYKGKMQMLEGKVSAFEIENGGLTRKNQEISNSLSNAEGRIAEQQDTIDSLHETIAENRKLIEEFASQLSAAQTAVTRKNSSTDEAVNMLNSQIRSLNAQIAENATKMQKMSADLHKKDEQIAEFESKTSHMTREKANLDKEIDERNKEISEMRSQLETDIADFSKLEDKLGTVERELKSCKETNVDFEKVINELSAKVTKEQKSGKEKDDIIARLRVENEKMTDVKEMQTALSTEISELRASLATKEREKAQIESQLTDLKSAMSRKESQMMQSVKQLSNEKEALEASFIDREKLFTSTEQQQKLKIDNLAAELSAVKLSEQQQKQRIDSFAIELSDLAKSHSAQLGEKDRVAAVFPRQKLEEKVEDLEGEIERWRKQASGSESSSVDLTAEIESLRKRCEEKDSAVLQEKSQREDIERDASRVKTALKHSEGEVSQLKSALEDAEGEISELKSALEDAERDILQLKSELEDSEREILQVRSQHEASIREQSQIQGEMTELANQFKEVESAKENLIDQLEDEKTRYKKLNEKHMKVESELKKNFMKITHLEEENESLRKRGNQTDSDGLQRSLEEMKRENAELKTQNGYFSGQLSDILSENALKQAEVDRKLQDAVALADQLYKAVESAEAEKSRFKDQLLSCEQTVSSLRSEAQDLRGQLESRNEDSEDNTVGLELKISSLEGELRLIREGNAGLVADLKKSKQRVTELEDTLQESIRSASQTEQDVRLTIEDQEKLQIAYSMLQSELSNLKETHANEAAKLRNAQQTNSELLGKIAILEQENATAGRFSGFSEEEKSERLIELENERLDLLQKIELLESELESLRFDRQSNLAESPERLSHVINMSKRQVIIPDLLDLEESPLYSIGSMKATPAKMKVCKRVRYDLQIWCLLTDDSEEPDFVWMKQEDIDSNLRLPPVADDEFRLALQDEEEKVIALEDDFEIVKSRAERAVNVLRKLLPADSDFEIDSYIDSFLDRFRSDGPIPAGEVSFVEVGSPEAQSPREQSTPLGYLSPEEAQSLIATIKRLEAVNEELERTLQLQEQQLKLLHAEHRAKAREGETGQTPEPHFIEVFASFAKSLPQL